MRFSIMVVVLVLALLPNAWAQGSKPSTLADLTKYNGADRERILYEGAKKEGKLLWYTSLVPNKHIAKVFQAKYPGIAVDVYRGHQNERLDRAHVYGRRLPGQTPNAGRTQVYCTTCSGGGIWRGSSIAS